MGPKLDARSVTFAVHLAQVSDIKAISILSEVVCKVPIKPRTSEQAAHASLAPRCRSPRSRALRRPLDPEEAAGAAGTAAGESEAEGVNHQRVR